VKQRAQGLNGVTAFANNFWQIGLVGGDVVDGAGGSFCSGNDDFLGVFHEFADGVEQKFLHGI